MTSNAKMPIQHFYIIIFACALIILCESVQVLERVKNIDNYDMWVQLSGPIDFEIYFTIQVSYFFERLTVPVLLGLYSYVAFIKIRINKLFVIVWEMLLGGAFVYTLMEQDFTSILYYLKITSYIALIITIFRLWQVIVEYEQQRG